MMMRMLEAGGMPILTDNIRTADVHNPHGYYEFEPVKRVSRDSAWLIDVYGKAFKLVYRLLYDLPNDHYYRVIFMRRKLAEIIASQERMLRQQGKEGGALDDAQLEKLFRIELRRLEVWLASQENFRVLYLSYNNLMEQPRHRVVDVERFLECTLDKDAMLHVVDPSLYRQRS
jgi:Sulfotransferase domain